MFDLINESDLLNKAKEDLQSYRLYPNSHTIFNLFITIRHIEDYFVGSRPPQDESMYRKKIKEHFSEKYKMDDVHLQQEQTLPSHKGKGWN